MTLLPTGIPMGEICHSENGVVVRDLFGRIGDKWTMLVIGVLETGPQRFSMLRESVPGISQRMLTLTLRHLERDGLVSREAFAEVPPRVEYTLTPLGQELLPAVSSIAQWAIANKDLIGANRESYDAV